MLLGRIRQLVVRAKGRSASMLALRIIAAVINAAIPLAISKMGSSSAYGGFVSAISIAIFYDTILQIYLSTAFSAQLVASGAGLGANPVGSRIRLLLACGIVVGIATCWQVIVQFNVKGGGLAVLLTYPLVITFVRVSEIYQRFNKRPLIGFVLSQIVPPITQLAISVLIVLIGRAFDIQAALTAVWLGFLASSALQWRVIQSFATDAVSASMLSWRELAKEAIRLAGPGVAVVGELLPIFILSAAHNYAAIAIFEVVRRFAWVPGFVASATWAAHSMDYAHLVGNLDRRGLQMRIQRDRVSVRTVGAMVIAIVAIVAWIYIGLMGGGGPSGTYLGQLYCLRANRVSDVVARIDPAAHDGTREGVPYRHHIRHSDRSWCFCGAGRECSFSAGILDKHVASSRYRIRVHIAAGFEHYEVGWLTACLLRRLHGVSPSLS